ncbi:MAG: hypothetical protein Q8Q31_04370 [Nanoarchaeota archaeon]|nr:hypothetical protein [Nanoarchaeota archaeon]
MGHYGGKRREGERPGASKNKVVKEMKHGRIKNESSSLQGREDQRERILKLWKDIGQQRDPAKREPLYLQVSNAIAGCRPEVYLPDEVGGIQKASIFYDNDAFRSLTSRNMGMYGGVSLPLHHLVKILAKDVFQPEEMHRQGEDHYLYIVGMQESEDPKRFDLDGTNLHALEAFLLGFSGMIRKGGSFELEINGTSVQVPYSQDPYLSENNPALRGIRNVLCQRSVRMNDTYVLDRINDGGERVSGKLSLTTQMHYYREEDADHTKVAVAVSSFRLKSK